MKKITLSLVFIMAVALSYSQNDNNETNQQLSEEDRVAKQLQNPVASLISVPIQGNFDFGLGPTDGNRMTINIQPVIPFSISEKWNLITRIILPVISQNNVFDNSGNQFGLSDAVISAFLSPKAPTSGGIIWGAGPAFLVPTSTDNMLGTEKFGIGPTAVILKQAGSITYGGLVNHIFSVAGNKDRADVNASFFQPFLAKNFEGGYALALNTELSQDWDNNATNGNLHLIGSKVFHIGSQMAQVAIGPRIPYGNGNSAEWGFRANFVLLFPKG